MGVVVQGGETVAAPAMTVCLTRWGPLTCIVVAMVAGGSERGPPDGRAGRGPSGCYAQCGWWQIATQSSCLKCRDPVAAADWGKEMITFQQAYEAAVACYPRDEWEGLSPTQRTRAIYDEMRRLDAEVAALQVDALTTRRKKHDSQTELRPSDQEQLEPPGDRGVERRGGRFPHRVATQQRR